MTHRSRRRRHRWSPGIVAILAVFLAACAPVPSTGPATPTAPPGSAAPTPPASVETEPPAPLPLEILETGFSGFGDDGDDFASYGAVILNPNESWSVVRMELHVDFYDAADAFMVGQDVTITARPGQRIGIAGQVHGAGRAARIEIVPPSDTTSFRWTGPLDEAFEATNVETDRETGQTVTVGRLASRFPTEQSFVQLTAIFRDAAGAIVGGSGGGVQSIVAGGTAPFEVIDASPYEDISATEIYWQVAL